MPLPVIILTMSVNQCNLQWSAPVAIITIDCLTVKFLHIMEYLNLKFLQSMQTVMYQQTEILQSK